MVYLFVKAPTTWSPSSTYLLTDTITLKSAGHRLIDNYPLAGGASEMDTLYFISSSLDLMELRDLLRTWVMFHDFILDSQLCRFFERQYLDSDANTTSAYTIEGLQQEPKANMQICDYDDIAQGIYAPAKSPLQVSYKELFARYRSLSEVDTWLLRSYLFQLETRDTYSIDHNLFEATRKYWQITSYVTLLENIFDHAPDCPGSVKSCSVCGKKLSHRLSGEKVWRKERLATLIADKELRSQYLRVIETAFTIRHKTAHAAIVPPTPYPETAEVESYKMDRAIHDLTKDMFALDGFIELVRRVLRYLLLDKFFDLKTFPPLPESRVTTILKWVAPTND
jgi:hypothetical protein